DDNSSTRLRYPGQRTRGRRCNLVALGNPKVILTNLSTTRRVVTRAAATTPSGMNYDDSLEIPSESYDLSFGIAYDVKSATNRSCTQRPALGTWDRLVSATKLHCTPAVRCHTCRSSAVGRSRGWRMTNRAWSGSPGSRGDRLISMSPSHGPCNARRLLGYRQVEPLFGDD